MQCRVETLSWTERQSDLMEVGFGEQRNVLQRDLLLSELGFVCSHAQLCEQIVQRRIDRCSSVGRHLQLLFHPAVAPSLKGVQIPPTEL